MNTRNTWLGDVLLAVVGYGGVMALFAVGVMYTTQKRLEQTFNQSFETPYAVEDGESPLTSESPPVAALERPPLAFAGAAN